MDIKVIKVNNENVVVVDSALPVVTDVNSVLDLIATSQFVHDANHIAISKTALPEEFFKLSSGFAGEILQKFVTYRTKLAVFGDFSEYGSKPLKDFMTESNAGDHIFFTRDAAQAIAKLTKE